MLTNSIQIICVLLIYQKHITCRVWTLVVFPVLMPWFVSFLLITSWLFPDVSCLPITLCVYIPQCFSRSLCGVVLCVLCLVLFISWLESPVCCLYLLLFCFNKIVSAFWSFSLSFLNCLITTGLLNRDSLTDLLENRGFSTDTKVAVLLGSVRLHRVTLKPAEMQRAQN